MRNRLSIFSSRLRGSALIWAILLVAGFEYYQALHLPQMYSSHEVDVLLQQLDRPLKTAPTLILGDSVARQVGHELANRYPDKVLSLACNAAVETAGQYYILKRYADLNPMPEKVVLMMRYPLAGDLETIFTENFIQRCFVRWSEIGGLAMAKKDPVFTTMMIAYKIFPSLRYRNHLQKVLPGLAEQEPSPGDEALKQNPPKPSAKSRLTMGPRETISSMYLSAIADYLHQKNVPLVFVWSPRPEANRDISSPAPPLPWQFERLLKQYPEFKIVQPPLYYPDAWFGDGVHLLPQPLKQVVNDYLFLQEAPP